VKNCEIYIGIFGKEYSLLAQRECIAALDHRKRYLVYIMDLKTTDRDPRVTDFIESTLKIRLTYAKFQNCKKLEEQIQKDLNRLMLKLLREGYAVTTRRKREIKSGEQKLKDKVYSSPSPSDNKETSSILDKARFSYESGQYFAALINTSAYVELLLRRVLTEANKKDYSKAPLHVLLSDAVRQNLLGKNAVTSLKDFWPVRNKAVHEGLMPSRSDTENLLEVANFLEKEFSSKLENSPILTERDRRLIATRFLKKLCELDNHARQNSLPPKFSMDQIWRSNLGGFNIEIVGQFTVTYLRDKLKFINQDSQQNIFLTKKGAEHCGKDIDIILPPGI
jgi:HEPN domain-containing protein